MINEAKILRDGFTSLLSGQDSGNKPDLLARDAYAFGINLTARGGFVDQRPPYVSPELTFATEEIQTYFKTKVFQGWKIYHPALSDSSIVISTGGRLFRISPLNNFKVDEITPTRETVTTADFISPPQGSNVTISVSDTTRIAANFPITIGDGRYQVQSITISTVTARNDTATPGVNIASGTKVVYLDINEPKQKPVWMEQAEQYLVVQDNRSLATIFDGANSRRADPQKREVPTGNVMAYGHGRLWVALTDGISFVAGDIAGGESTVVQFTENDYLNEGGTFRVPSNTGNIRAMVFPANLDTSLGQGPLQVFTPRAVISVNAPVTREIWKALQVPIQTTSMIEFGALAQDSAVLVNGDIWFRARDGLRSFVIAQRQFGQWGNVPNSREMNRILDRDDQSLLRYGSACLFHNRLLFSVGPRRDGDVIYHGGLGVLDFDLISSLTVRANPAYDGLWTGIKPQGIISGAFNDKDRCFVMGWDTEAQENRLWELLPEGKFDGDEGRITSILETRSCIFQNPLELKRLWGCEIWPYNVSGTVDLDLKWRADQYPCWVDWGTRQICNAYEDCDTETGTCKTITEYRPGYRSRLGFGQPPEQPDFTDDKPARLGYQFQFRLAWTGRMALRGLVAKAVLEHETPDAPAE